MPARLFEWWAMPTLPATRYPLQASLYELQAEIVPGFQFGVILIPQARNFNLFLMVPSKPSKP
jgi:hypothetical protein